MLPLTVGRESSIQLIESLGEDRSIVVTAQKDARLDLPTPEDMHKVGTLATVHQIVRMPSSSRCFLRRAWSAFAWSRFDQETEPFMVAEVEALEPEQAQESPNVEALMRIVIAQFQQIVSESPTLSDELRTIAANIEEPSRLVRLSFFLAVPCATEPKQELQNPWPRRPPRTAQPPPGQGNRGAAAPRQDPE